MDGHASSSPHAQQTPPQKNDTDSNTNSNGVKYEPTCKHPHQNDVLCGRGGVTNRHVGNAHWRSLIVANKRLYIKLPRRQKMLVTESIVKAVRSQDPPGRFLKLDTKTGLWTDVGDKKAIAKTAQALREGAPKLRGEMCAEEAASLASSLPYSESDAASVLSTGGVSVSELIAAGQNQAAAEVAASAAVISAAMMGSAGGVGTGAVAGAVAGDASSAAASAYMSAAASVASSPGPGILPVGLVGQQLPPSSLVAAAMPQPQPMTGAPVAGPGHSVATAVTEAETDYYSAAGGGASSIASSHTPLAANMMLGPMTLAQVTSHNVATGAATQEYQQVQQQQMMPPPPPRQPQRPHQGQQDTRQQQQPPSPQPQIQAQPPQPPIQVQQPQTQMQAQPQPQMQLQSSAQLQNEMAQITLMLKQLEIQVQSQGMQITPEQQAQYTFLMNQQQMFTQMIFLAQQQEQLVLQQQQVMQSVGGGGENATLATTGQGTAPTTAAGTSEGSGVEAMMSPTSVPPGASASDILASALDRAKTLQPPPPSPTGQEQQQRERRSTGFASIPSRGLSPAIEDMMRTDTLGTFGMGSVTSNSLGSLANFDESDGKLPIAMDSKLSENNSMMQTQDNTAPAPMGINVAAAPAAPAPSNPDEQQEVSNENPSVSKAQKRLSQEDLARWSRVKAMLAKTSSIGTSTTEPTTISQPRLLNGQSSDDTAAPPAAAAAAASGNQQHTSLNRDVSMMSTLSGLSGIMSAGEAGDLLVRGDTRGNGTVNMTDITRDVSAAMSEMSLSRGPSLTVPGDIFGNAQNGGAGLTPGSLTGGLFGDDDDDREDQFKSLRTGGANLKPPIFNPQGGGGGGGAAAVAAGEGAADHNGPADSNSRSSTSNGTKHDGTCTKLSHDEQVQLSFLQRGASLAGEGFGEHPAG